MYVEPSLSVLEVQQQGERAALLVGDMLWACLNRHMYCQYAAGLHNDLAFVSQVSDFPPRSITTFFLVLLIRSIVCPSYFPKLEYFLSSKNT